MVIFSKKKWLDIRDDLYKRMDQNKKDISSLKKTVKDLLKDNHVLKKEVRMLNEQLESMGVIVHKLNTVAGIEEMKAGIKNKGNSVYKEWMRGKGNGKRS